MSIRNRLTILITTIFAALMIIFILVVYYSYARNREEEYYNLLRNTAITKANLLLDAKVSASVLQLIYQNSDNTLFQEEVAVYDTSYHLLYHDRGKKDRIKETKEMIDFVKRNKEIRFYQGGMQVIGLLHFHNSTAYIITSAANDSYGYAKLRSLKYILILGFFGMVILISISARLLSIRVLRPVSEMVDEVEEITAKNLDLRIGEGNGRDEMAELAMTFNRMLDRLENSFDAQRDFVSNISHELRTPITAMLAELQLCRSKDRSLSEYRESMDHAIGDGQKLVRLSNGLLDLAKADYDPTKITFKVLRLDEVVLDASNSVLHNQPDFTVGIAFEDEIKNDEEISIKGNRYLLELAVMNLMENGCKFSPDKKIKVTSSNGDRMSVLSFRDEGIGIDIGELASIFDPFYRGGNRNFAAGNGIGLYLTKKIIDLHKGTISVSSTRDAGTTFRVELPHL